MISDDVLRDVKEEVEFIRDGKWLPLYRRQDYVRILQFLYSKQAVAITGLRQVGKTTLLKQIAHERQQDFQFWYLSVDSLADKTPKTLNDLIYYFIKNSERKPLIIIDEIQKIPDWAETIKKFYDMQPVKFLLSGSASLKITKGKESLAGRMTDVLLPPLRFKEFLEMSGVEIEGKDTSLMAEKLSEKFVEYCFKGGFPELCSEENPDKIRLQIENNTVNKIVYEDIPEVFKVRNRALLFKLFKHGCEITGCLFDYSSIGAVYGVSKDTVRDYLFYLEQSFLLYEVPRYAKGVSKRERNLKKIFAANPSIAIQILHYNRNVLDTRLAGRFVETAVYNYLQTHFDLIRFWRDEQKREVDFLVDDDLLIEVKFQSRILSEDLKNIKVAMEDIPGARALVVTKNSSETREGISFIPAWRFMLMEKDEIRKAARLD